MTIKSAADQRSLVVYWHDEAMSHDTGFGVFEDAPSPLIAIHEAHPENASRILNIKSILERGPVAQFVEWRNGRYASQDELLLFHTLEHVEHIKRSDQSGPTRLDGAGTIAAPGSFDSARAAAGTSVIAMQDILNGKSRLAYVLVRPPGHHAQPGLADGSCLFNNLGIAARYALENGIERIAVIDWDQHHGNGTQEGFYDDDRVLTISMHMPHGPWGTNHAQTGEVREIGTGRGTGYNLNIPMPYGSGDAAYATTFEHVVAPVVDEFAPELILVACGFDSNQFDPNGRSLVTMSGFNTLGKQVRKLADKHCDGRLALFQEGGYAITYTAFCAHAAMEGCLGLDSSLDDPASYYSQPANEDLEPPTKLLEAWREIIAGAQQKN